MMSPVSGQTSHGVGMPDWRRSDMEAGQGMITESAQQREAGLAYLVLGVVCPEEDGRLEQAKRNRSEHKEVQAQDELALQERRGRGRGSVGASTRHPPPHAASPA